MTLEAAHVLGASVREARLGRRWGMQELAERLGVSRPTVSKIERGDPTVALGVALEAAALLGVPLFGGDARRAQERRRVDERVALLPKRARKPPAVDDEF